MYNNNIKLDRLVQSQPVSIVSLDCMVSLDWYISYGVFVSRADLGRFRIYSMRSEDLFLCGHFEILSVIMDFFRLF